jgi:hypothetical protein
MLTKRNLRALSPGQWARVRVPDFDIWQKPAEWSGPLAGKEVDVCVIPCYGPRYDSANMFHWSYRAAYRHQSGSAWSNYFDSEGNLLAPWTLGLIDASSNSPNWDQVTSREHYEGKGKWLYEPASDDPELCPGGDWSRYECDICKKFVRPFSNDDGNLICPWCEAAGLVILDDEQLERLEQVREFARSIGLSRQLERQLDYLANYANHDDGPKRQCVLSYDFAPFSFSFAHFALPTPGQEKPERKFWFNGGLIYQGPSVPADGSFPSLTVSLAPGTGWYCHTWRPCAEPAVACPEHSRRV